MVDLAASNLTYSFNIKDKVFIGRKGYQVRGTISFGNGSLTYPSGGIPLTKGKMGLPRFVRSLKVLETNAKGYVFEYDVSAEKLRLFVSAALALTGNVTAVGNVAAVTGNVSAPKINFGNAGANIAADLVIGVNALANAAQLVASNGAATNVTGIAAPTFTGDAPTFTGSAANVNISAVSAAALSEAAAASFAPAATVLEVEAEGY